VIFLSADCVGDVSSHASFRFVADPAVFPSPAKFPFEIGFINKPSLLDCESILRASRLGDV
jgi:hypothetical protein